MDVIHVSVWSSSSSELEEDDDDDDVEFDDGDEVESLFVMIDFSARPSTSGLCTIFVPGPDRLFLI